MKRLLVICLAILLSAALLTSGCSQGSDCSTFEAQNSVLAGENAAQKAEIEDARVNLDSLRAEHDSLKADYTAEKAQSESMASEFESVKAERSSLKISLDALQSDYNKAISDLKQIETNYQNLLNGTQQSVLRNPTWQELQTFLLEDATDTRQYSADQFDCSGFAITLRDQAWRRGFRSAYVEIGFVTDTTGHALNAFQTGDKGLIYVDNTERDQIAYVEKGKVYGVIMLDGVKEDFINCNMEPDEFWKPLNYARYTGNIFGYGYYQNYSQRSQFYKESVAAYNSDSSAYNIDADAYNAAVAVFNRGSSQYSYAEIESWKNKLDTWLTKLDTWSTNLDALSEDLGSDHVSPMGAVSTIETYWD